MTAGSGEGTRPLLSLVIPAYREAPHLAESITTILSHVNGLPGSVEVVVVDDGSDDGTWDVIRRLSAADDRVRGLQLSRNFGKEGAISAGLREARGRAAIVMDCDLQHPPALIPEMVRVWQETRADVVDGVKETRGRETLYRKYGAGLFTYLMTSLSGFDFSGATDFKLLDRRVIDVLLDLRENKLFYRGMVEWLGFKHARLPFEVQDGPRRRSAWSMLSLTRFAVGALVSFSSLPLRLVFLVGVLFLGMAVLLGVMTVARWFSGYAVTGFSTVILLQLISGSAILISLGIIGEFIAGIYDEVKRRPAYIVRERVGPEPK